jgi:hypothetical protein
MKPTAGGESYNVGRLAAPLRSPGAQTIRPGARSRQTHLALGVQPSNKAVVHPLSIQPDRLTATASSDSVCPRRPKLTTYRCSLPGLTGFMAPRRAGPGPQHRLSRQSLQSPDLEREFNPAIADCGYRAPLAPRLARPPVILPRRRVAVSRRIQRRKKRDMAELIRLSLTVDDAICPRMPPRHRQRLSLASVPPLM